MNTSKVVVLAVTVLSMLFADAMDRRCEQSAQARPLLRQWGSVSQGFQLSANLEGDVIRKAGDAIALELTIKNASKRVLSLTVSSPEKDYQVYVKNEKGEDVPLTEYGERLRQLAGDHLSRSVIKITAGLELKYRYPLGAVYNMTSSGSYYVTARRSVFRRDGKGIAELSSNEVKITVHN